MLLFLIGGYSHKNRSACEEICLTSLPFHEVHVRCTTLDIYILARCAAVVFVSNAIYYIFDLWISKLIQ